MAQTVKNVPAMWETWVQFLDWEEFSSKVIDIVTRRKGEVNSIDTKGDRVQLEFTIPSRGIIGLRNNLLTASNGEAIIAHRFKAYEPWKGEMGTYKMGALIAKETGTSTAYSISKLQDSEKRNTFCQLGSP